MPSKRETTCLLLGLDLENLGFIRFRRKEVYQSQLYT